MRYRLFASLAVLAWTSFLPAQDPRPVATQDFEKTHAMIKRQNGEWRWADLNWSINFADAQRRSLAEGRPIFVVLCAQGSVAGCL